MANHSIAVCIPTCRRSALLRLCLESVASLDPVPGHVIDVIVVDNDEQGSAQATVRGLDSSFPWKLHYFVHPEPGLSSVRNRLLQEAIGLGVDFIAFIDDDEQPDISWLYLHMRNMEKFDADVCCGPVSALGGEQLVSPAREKITGTRPRHVSTNNVVFRTGLVTDQGLRFDPFYNFIGGEDFDFFERSAKNGNSHIWVNEAMVRETIPAERDNLRYLFYRHFTGGINSVLRFKRTRPAWQAWGRFLPKIIGKLFAALYCCLLSCVRLNRALFASAVKKFASGTGYLAGLLNIVVERYGNIDSQETTHIESSQ